MEPACGERDIVVTILLGVCAVVHVCVRPAGIVPTRISTFMHGFQINFGTVVIFEE